MGFLHNGLCMHFQKAISQPRNPTTHECIIKMQHMYTIEYDAAAWNGKIMQVAATWNILC